MSNIQKQHKISPAIAWLTIQKFIIFYCPLDGEHTRFHVGTAVAQFIFLSVQTRLFRRLWLIGVCGNILYSEKLFRRVLV